MGRRSNWPLLILVLVPFWVHLPHILLGLSTDPLWITSGAVQGVRPGPVGGLPYLDPHAGYTSQALGRLAAQSWLHGRVPWWNPYSGVGLPLAGGMSPGAFFLPFLFLLVLPGGVLWLKIAMMILAGLATWALLRDLGLGRLASCTGAALFELNGTFAWMPGGCLTAPIPFLPLLLCGIERSRRTEGGEIGVVFVGTAIAGSLLAGFPETAYIDGLFALTWALFRLAGEGRRWAFAGRVLFGGALGLLVAAPLLVGFADYLFASDVYASHDFGARHLTGRAFAMLFLPYAYGPLHATHGNAGLVAIWNRAGGYASALVIFLALVGLGGPWERGLRRLLGLWVLFAWAKSFGLQPVAEIVNHFPFLPQTAFHRYAQTSWEMALILLAALALEDLGRERAAVPKGPLVIAAFGAAASVLIANPWRPSWSWVSGPPGGVARWFLLSALWTCASLAAATIAWRLSTAKRRQVALTALAIAESSALFILPTLSGVHPGTVDWPAIRFLQEHAVLDRFYTLGPVLPNYGAYFQVASINHNTLPIASDWQRYITQSLFPPLEKCRGGAVFWPAWYSYETGAGRACLLRFLSNYERLSVRYVLTRAGENLSVSAPRRLDGLAAAMRVSQPEEKAGGDRPAGAPGIRAVYADSLLAIWELPDPAPYYSVLTGSSSRVSEAEHDSVTVSSAAPALLVRRELYMAGWRAEVNGAPVPVRRFGDLLQCVSLPAGESGVRFRFAPPYSRFGWAACALGLLGMGLGLWRFSMRKARGFDGADQVEIG